MPKSVRPLVIIILAILLAAAGYYLVRSNPLVKNSQFADSAIIFSGSKSINSSTSVFVMAKDGSVTELAPAGYTNMLGATFSPDRTRIAFAATHGNKEVIAVMNADGSSVMDVSKFDGPKTMPSWSLDGSSLIYALATQGGGVSKINIGAGTDIVVPVGADSLQTPFWLPSGLGFDFVKVTVDQKAGVMVTQLANYNDNRVTDVTISGDKSLPVTDLGSPSVSPDGKTIAFVRTSDNQIYLVNTNGKDLKALTKPNGSIYSCPSWTNDGKSILVAEATLAGKNYISKVDVESGAVTRSVLSGFAKVICPREARY